MHSGQNYKLEFPFVDHSYDNLVIDDVEVRVILPEGARLVTLNFTNSVSCVKYRRLIFR